MFNLQTGWILTEQKGFGRHRRTANSDTGVCPVQCPSHLVQGTLSFKLWSLGTQEKRCDLIQFLTTQLTPSKTSEKYHIQVTKERDLPDHSVEPGCSLLWRQQMLPALNPFKE